MEIRWVERILLRDLETLKREIGAFPDEASIWATPPGITNSAGTLALHIAGNLQHFIGAGLGKSGYVRDRDKEFAARGVPRAELLAGLDRAGEAVRLLATANVDPNAQLPEPVGKFQFAAGDWLIHLATHLAFHVGQVGYLRRVVTGESKSVPSVSMAELASAVKLSDPA